MLFLSHFQRDTTSRWQAQIQTHSHIFSCGSLSTSLLEIASIWNQYTKLEDGLFKYWWPEDTCEW